MGLFVAGREPYGYAIDKPAFGGLAVVADLETVKTFTSEIRELMVNEENITPQDKRKVLQLLHVRVFIDKPAGELGIGGWFGPAVKGLLHPTSGRYGPQANVGPECRPRHRSP
jgi:hypothetical protein